MKKIVSITLVACLVMGLLTNTDQGFADSNKIQGSLVIVGGGLESSSADIYNAFINKSIVDGDYKIGILPAASGKPSKYAKLFKDDLVSIYGLDPAKIHVIPIAVKDDSSTDDIDESTWIDNSFDEDLASEIETYTGIWFTGGDQTRITKALLRDTQAQTPALKAIWSAYEDGACLGGTSAGAAIMSDVMIAGGDSLGALGKGFKENFESYDEQEHGPVIVSKGLGFFKYGVVDQHFDRKARLGRLIVVNDAYKKDYPIGFGVDENTAMVFDNQTMTVQALGQGGVTLVDVKDAQKKIIQGQPEYKDIKISYFEGGDTYNIGTGTFEVNSQKLDTVGYEYLYVKDPAVTGVLSRNSLYKHLITYDLVDNEAAQEVFSYAFDKDGKGFKIRFHQKEDTTGWWGYLDGLLDHYSALNVYMDIEPIQVDISPLEDLEVKNQTHKVQPGEVLWKIAAHYKVSTEELVEMNKLEDPDLLIPDQVILLP